MRFWCLKKKKKNQIALFKFGRLKIHFDKLELAGTCEYACLFPAETINVIVRDNSIFPFLVSVLQKLKISASITFHYKIHAK